MEMDKIHDQLDNVKAEVEKLREECGANSMLSDSVRRAHVEQLAKTQQEKLKLDKLARELDAKSHEIFEIRQLYEKLQSSLHRKDLFLQQISSTSKKLQAEQNEKILKLEGENMDLVLSLDEALERIQDLEKKACASSEEIVGLKRLLSIKQENNSEVQKNASKDLKEREEYILKLEEESRISQDQLKWKYEQFSYLEEAHKKLRVQFQESKLEWQKEKSLLVDQISSLQDNLDAQIRVSKSLETQLRISNQALAHEESRREVVEVEMSEYRSKLENVFLECQEAKSEIEQLTMKRDGEIAELRTILRKKEILANEMKYKIQQLEQDSSNLLVSMKDIQEVRLHNNATSSLKKLRNKLQGVEQMHGICALNLKEKEEEWNSKIEKLTRDVNHCLSELAVKSRSIRKLHKELEDCQCLLEAKSEEISALVMVLKSEFHSIYSKLYDSKEKLEMGIMQIEEKNMFLDQQLQSKNTELHKVHAELKLRSDEVSALMERVESLKRKDDLMEEELRRWKVMLDESNECRSRLEQQLQESKETQRASINNTLEMANKTSEIEKWKLELQESKSEVEILKLNLKENQKAREQEITDLLVTVNYKDAKIRKLQEQVSVLESEILAKSEAEEILNQEKDNYIQLAEDRNCCMKSLQNEIAQLKNDLAEREAANSALLVAHSTLGQKIQELEKDLEALECRKILEVEEKKQEVISLREEVECQEKSLVQAREVALWAEETKKSEVQELRSQLEKEKRCFEGLVEGMCGRIGVLCAEDVELMGMLGKLSLFTEEEDSEAVVTNLFNNTTSRKSGQVSFDGRTPLVELNC